MPKPKTTPSNQPALSSKHFPFAFYFSPNCPDYTSKFFFPTKLTKFCTKIQHKTEEFVNKTVEVQLSKRNQNKNTQAPNAKPKFKNTFTSRENPSPPPIHQLSPTNTNTTRTKTTQNTQLTCQNQIASCHITQNFPHNTNATLYQTSTNHTLKRTYIHTIYQPSLPKWRSPSPSSTSHTAPHLLQHTSAQPTSKTHVNITYLTTIISSPQFWYLYQQYKTHTYSPFK